MDSKYKKIAFPIFILVFLAAITFFIFSELHHVLPGGDIHGPGDGHDHVHDEV